MPDLEYQSQVAPEALPGRAYPHIPQEFHPGAFGGEVGRATEYAGSEVQRVTEAAVSQARQTQLTDAHNQLQALSLDLTHNPQTGALTRQGKDAFGLGQKYLPSYDERAAAIVAGVPDPRARQAASLAAAQVRDHLSEQLDTHEINQHREYGLSTAQASITLAQQVAGANANHPDIIAAQRDHILASVDSLAEQRGWGPDDPQRKEAIARSMDGLHTQVVRALVAGGKMDMAQAYVNTHLAEMDPNTSESAQRLIYATQEHQLVFEERLQKRASDNLTKQGLALEFQGKLTPAWVEAHRDVLEPNEVKYFYGTLSGKDESSTDPRVFADLLLRAANGEDVRGDAKSALVDSHSLSRADFSKVVTSVDQTRPGWYKRGVQFLNEALDPGQLNPDPAAHQSKAYALDDWQQWAAAHKDATDDQARKAYTELSHHYQMVPDEKTQLLMRAPRFLIGTRTNPVDEDGKPDPQLRATGRRLLDALQRGEISPQDAQREAVLIDRYRKLATAQAAAKAKAAEQP